MTKKILDVFFLFTRPDIGAFGQEAREDPAYLLREAEKKAKKREDSDVRDKENAQKRARRAEDGEYRDALHARENAQKQTRRAEDGEYRDALQVRDHFAARLAKISAESVRPRDGASWETLGNIRCGVARGRQLLRLLQLDGGSTPSALAAARPVSAAMTSSNGVARNAFEEMARDLLLDLERVAVEEDRANRQYFDYNKNHLSPEDENEYIIAVGDKAKAWTQIVIRQCFSVQEEIANNIPDDGERKKEIGEDYEISRKPEGERHRPCGLLERRRNQ
ncbi:hypothetical protein THAOC_07251 [Thalassiosira oceanica]|uniref:Uncharacterized protein n=1 Tax=Thalassiosira oceanica TaxID=159749 RepID=K0SY22_THAOC|nr:hypothetical protein THAOC_07251 [Thalassiosira oceanica]|eukprot:EJK71328.1 hypothetical protein THAOC_07251 [Thalassiosira oceanica]